MAKDLALIKQLEQKIGKELNKFDLNDLDNDVDDCFVVDRNKNVIGLNLSRIELTSISKIILTFNNLKKLSLLDIELKDLHFLKELQYLTNLNLRNSKIKNLDSLEELTNLKRLNLANNQIRDALFIKELQNLEILDLSLNELSDLTCIKDLNKLRKLYLSHNQISDLSFLHSLENLTLLDLRYNQISDVSTLLNFKNLTDLDLRDNKIHVLPSNFIDMEMEIKWEWDPMGGTFLEGNPLETPPIEIAKKGKKAIKTYFESVPIRHLNEVKVLLVGDGGAGKTSLMKRLMGEGFDKNESQTHGINLKFWKIKVNKTEIKIRFWDFGGQEIMHATHQFFFSKRSLYVLVIDGRKCEDEDYWFKLIESLGGDSPILVVINKIDENPGFDLNRNFLKDKYQTIKGFDRISCCTAEGIDDFKRNLKSELADMSLPKTLLADNWLRVKSQLENMKENFISFEKYEDICLRENISNYEHCHTLVEYLHDLGVILHFSDSVLKETNVINPKWITEAVYAIINSRELTEHQGILKKTDLKSILDTEIYNPNRHDFIVELMKKFELCYSMDRDTILIPDLLPVNEPEFSFNQKTALKFQIHYNFLPRSIIPRFIVRMQHDIKGELRWRTGVILEDSAFGSCALVKADIRDKKIYLYVQGEHKRNYFSVIWYGFRNITRDFKRLEYDNFVPLPDRENILVNYDTLMAHEELGEEFIVIPEVREKYHVGSLLDGIEDESFRNFKLSTTFEWDVFISYSSKDVSIVKRIVNDLKKNGIRYWWDKEQIFPGDSISKKIAEGLESSLCVMPCFSHFQIKSGWCRAEYTSFLSKVFSGVTKQKVTPLILDDLKLEDCPILLRDYKYVRLSDSESYVRLIQVLKRKV